MMEQLKVPQTHLALKSMIKEGNLLIYLLYINN